MQPVLMNFAEREWRNDVTPEDWDQSLAELGGHPLQSALWGKARQDVDNIRDERWMVTSEGQPNCLVRFEDRVVPLVGRVAWAPRGPAGAGFAFRNPIYTDIFGRLKERGVSLVVLDPWQEASTPPTNGGCYPRTIWIDLSQGQEALWKSLHPNCRYSVRRAEKDGIVIETTYAPLDTQDFFSLCARVSKDKGFHLPASAELMSYLLINGQKGDVEVRLFVARDSQNLCAGAFIFRCGRSLHYFWGATDRRFSNSFVGVAVQWAAMLWGIEKGCTRYDLEGIDPIANRGVYEFKKKLGGKEILLSGKQYHPLNLRGHLISCLDRRLR